MNFFQNEINKQVLEIKTYLNNIIIELEDVCCNFEDLEGVELINLDDFDEIWGNYYRLKNEEIKLMKLLQKFKKFHLYEDDVKEIIINEKY